LFENLPSFIRNRIIIYTDFNWNNYFKNNWQIVLISLLIGIISHLFWDAFTHNHGYFVNKIDVFRNKLFLFHTEIPFWKIAQHGSTILGSIFIIVTFLKLQQDFSFKTTRKKSYWKFIILSTSVILFIRFAIQIKDLNIGNFIVTFISSFLISTILIPLIIKLKSSIKN